MVVFNVGANEDDIQAFLVSLRNADGVGDEVVGLVRRMVDGVVAYELCFKPDAVSELDFTREAAKSSNLVSRVVEMGITPPISQDR
jgi:hypothetical protein